MKNMKEIIKLKEKNKKLIEYDNVSITSKNLVLENSKRFNKRSIIYNKK